ncbi:MAG: hypothetical protein QXO73_03920, partial [Archaeoglobaceae archaeon]
MRISKLTLLLLSSLIFLGCIGAEDISKNTDRNQTQTNTPTTNSTTTSNQALETSELPEELNVSDLEKEI